MRIAFLEDDKDQADLIEEWIKQAGHDCNVFSKGKTLIRELSRDSYDLLILDWMLPDIDGVQVLRWVREHIDWPLPVLFVTARDAEEDVVTALDAGADDYMSKPIKRAELMARINAVARRAHQAVAESGEVSFPPYRFILSTRTIQINDQSLEATQKEFDLAYFLFRNIGRVMARAHILESVWGASGDLNTRTVDTHVSRIRTKLSLKGDHGWYLRSVYQHGYRLEHLDDGAGTSSLGHTEE